MTYDLAPAHADPEAPLPGGIGYAESYELHPDCPGKGSYAVEIHPITGATCECCTGCTHRRIIGAYRPSVVPTPAEPARKPMGMNAPRVVKKKAKAPAAFRACANPACDHVLTAPERRTCCSRPCAIAVARLGRLKQIAAIRAGTIPAPPPQTRTRICADCARPFEQNTRARLDHVPHCADCRAGAGQVAA